MCRLLVFFLSSILFLGCGNKNESPKPTHDTAQTTSEKKIKKKKSKKTTVKKEEVKTITRKNAVEFLTKYGKENKETVVLFETRLGNMKVRLYEDTPIHRASFIFLTKKGYFSTTCVHRIVEDFVVQGGNSEHPKTRKFRREFDQYTIPAEFRDHRKHKYGAIATARDWDDNPNKRSTPFEFYFVQDKNGSHHLDGEHTIFGEIIEGFDTLDKIAKVKVGNDEWPIEDVFFKVTVVK